MIIGQKISTRMFSFDKERNNFTQEISSLRDGGNVVAGQLYDDACDEGFVLVSDKTGVEIPFYLTFVETNIEDEIQCWNFKAVCTYGRQPDIDNLTVTIFND